MRSKPVRRGAAIALMSTVAITLTACGSAPEQTPAGEQQPAQPPLSVAEPVVATYDGGLWVLDGKTLKVQRDIRLSGFNRLNPAGDREHVMVSTSDEFRLLNAATAQLTDVRFDAPEPGHVVNHAGRTVLFSDGTGKVTSFDQEALGQGKPETREHTAAEPHHGVAIELSNGEMVLSLGNEEERTGIAILDQNRKEIARNEDCPGVHGEAVAAGETVVIGCENGALIYRAGQITKVTSPTPYGRIGNQAGSEHSPVVLGDYKQDEDAELERPQQVSLINTTDGTLRLVELGTSYTFRSLDRGPNDEAVVLGTDGQLHIIDPVAARVVRTIPVLGQWQEPLEWQEPRPALFIRGNTAYVSDPAKREIHAVDLTTGEKTATGALPAAPNELSGTPA